TSRWCAPRSNAAACSTSCRTRRRSRRRFRSLRRRGRRSRRGSRGGAARRAVDYGSLQAIVGSSALSTRSTLTPQGPILKRKLEIAPKRIKVEKVVSFKFPPSDDYELYRQVVLSPWVKGVLQQLPQCLPDH